MPASCIWSMVGSN